MKIRVEYGDFSETEVVLRCRRGDEEALSLQSLLREHASRLAAYRENEVFLVEPGDLLYAESVDGKTFVYTENQVLETKLTLMQVHTRYEDNGIIRIGKSQLINLYQVGKLKSLPHSRIEVMLKNGEKLIVSRHYSGELKERLGLFE